MKILAVLISAASFMPIVSSGQVCAKQIKVPEYPAVAWAGHRSGTVELTATLGLRGNVIDVQANGSNAILIDHVKENVKDWIFCEPAKAKPAHVRLRFDYRLGGNPVYPQPTAEVTVDLGQGTVVVNSLPPKLER